LKSDRVEEYKYLIIGSNGFVGSNLHIRLAKNLHLKNIYSLDKGCNTFNYSNYINCDLNNFEDLEKKLKTTLFDVVIYLAADTRYTDNMNYFDIMYEANVKGLKNILQLLQENQNIRKFIYFSTCEIYGDSLNFSKESDIVNPITLYSLTKSMAEDLVKFYMNRFDFPATIIRPALVYGSGQNERFFIPQAINKFLNKEEFDMTKGEQARDFIYIDDLLDALLKIINMDVFVKDIVNISSNFEIKLCDLIILIKKILKSDTKVNFGSIEYRENEIMNFKMSNDKIFNIIGWTPRMTIEKGLKEMISKNKIN